MEGNPTVYISDMMDQNYWKCKEFYIKVINKDRTIIYAPTINATALAECPEIRRKDSHRSTRKPRINTIITQHKLSVTNSSAIRSNYEHLVSLHVTEQLDNNNKNNGKSQVRAPSVCVLCKL